MLAMLRLGGGAGGGVCACACVLTPFRGTGNKQHDVLHVTDYDVRSGWLIETHPLPSPQLEAAVGLA